MADLSDAVEILKRASAARAMPTTTGIEVSSPTAAGKPPVYTLISPSRKVIAMMEDLTDSSDREVIAEIRSN